MTSFYWTEEGPIVTEVLVPGPPGIGLPEGLLGDIGKYLRLRRSGGNPYDYELVSPDAVGLPQDLSPTSSPTFAGLTLAGMVSSVGRLVLVGANGQLTTVLLGTGLSITDGTLNAAGGGGGTSAYVHQQSTPAGTWTINHNLGYRPSVELLDSGSQEIDGEVSHPTVNQTVVTLNPATAGLARLI